MTRHQMVVAVGKLASLTLVAGWYVNSDNGEPYAGADFCREHAEIVARWCALEDGVVTWASCASMGQGEDGHRHCEFGGCDRHLDFGGLTDYGIDSALGLTESDPRACHVYASELELAARSMSVTDPRWELWEHHARLLLKKRGRR